VAVAHRAFGRRPARSCNNRFAIHVILPIDAREDDMVTLTEALAAERAKRQQDEADTSTRQQIGRAVLEALADRLNAEPLAAWAFALDGQVIHILRNETGARQQVGTWTVDQQMRLMAGDQMTEWITAESYARVIDEAVQITAKLIVEAEMADAAKSNKGAETTKDFQGAEIVELPPRL
jgi:hypothetical protein